MPLPSVALPTATHKIGAEEVSIRGLSRAEMVDLNELGQARDEHAAEEFMIVNGTGVSEGEAKAWLKATPSGEADKLLEAIAKLSGLPWKGGKDPQPSTSEPS